MLETSQPLTKSGTVLSAQSAGINASATDISVFSGPTYDYLYVLTPGYEAVQAYIVRGPGDFYMMQQFNLSCMPSEIIPNKGFVVSCRLIHDARAYLVGTSGLLQAMVIVLQSMPSGRTPFSLIFS